MFKNLKKEIEQQVNMRKIVDEIYYIAAENAILNSKDNATVELTDYVLKISREKGGIDCSIPITLRIIVEVLEKRNNQLKSRIDYEKIYNGYFGNPIGTIDNMTVKEKIDLIFSNYRDNSHKIGKYWLSDVISLENVCMIIKPEIDTLYIETMQRIESSMSSTDNMDLVKKRN